MRIGGRAGLGAGLAGGDRNSIGLGAPVSTAARGGGISPIVTPGMSMSVSNRCRCGLGSTLRLRIMERIRSSGRLRGSMGCSYVLSITTALNGEAATPRTYVQAYSSGGAMYTRPAATAVVAALPLGRITG